MTDSACLTGYAAARNGCFDIVFACKSRGFEGLTDNELKSFETEIVVNISAVDSYFAGTLINANAGNGMFLSACSVEIRSFGLVHQFRPP